MSQKVVGLIRTGGVILLFIIGIILIMNAMGSSAVVDAETGEITEDADTVTGSVTYALYLVYACLGAILIFTIWSIIQNPKRFIPSAIGIGIFAVIAFIGYAMASDAIIPDLLEHPDATAGAHKWGGAGIKTTYILVGLAIVLILIGSVMNMRKYFSK